MKKLILFGIVAVAYINGAIAQEPRPFIDRENDSVALPPPPPPPPPPVPLPDDTIEREIMGDKPEVDKSGDTTRIRLGKKGIVIVEKDGKTTVHIDKADEDVKDHEYYGDHKEYNNEHDDWDFKKKTSNKFKPHFAGLELNLNNYLSRSNSLNLPQNAQFMELNTGKSIGVRLNFMEFDIPINSRMGFVTGVGLEFNSYYFSSDSNNIKKENGRIVAKIKPAGSSPYEKNKLKDTYLNIPLFYEVQFPLGNANRPLYFSIGVIGGIKISSSTKEYYNLQGEGDKKIKVKDDYYLSPFRYGVQAKLGFRMIHLVGTYFMSPLFQENKGPELYPFDIGLVLLNF